MGNKMGCCIAERDTPGDYSGKKSKKKTMRNSYQDNLETRPCKQPDQAPELVEASVAPETDEAKEESTVIDDDADMVDFLWDGPSDSDEEVECMIPHKNDWEKANGVKFSKRGLI